MSHALYLFVVHFPILMQIYAQRCYAYDNPLLRIKPSMVMHKVQHIRLIAYRTCFEHFTSYVNWLRALENSGTHLYGCCMFCGSLTVESFLCSVDVIKTEGTYLVLHMGFYFLYLQMIIYTSFSTVLEAVKLVLG